MLDYPSTHPASVTLALHPYHPSREYRLGQHQLEVSAVAAAAVDAVVVAASALPSQNPSELHG